MHHFLGHQWAYGAAWALFNVVASAWYVWRAGQQRKELERRLAALESEANTLVQYPRLPVQGDGLWLV